MFSLVDLKPIEIGSPIAFFGRRADLRAILTSVFLSRRHENMYILKARTGIMWLG